MPELAPVYESLNKLVGDNRVDIDDLFARRSATDLDLIDVWDLRCGRVKTLGDVAIDMVALSRIAEYFGGHGGGDFQAAYRGFYFVHAVSESVSEYKFEIAFSKIVEPGLSQDDARHCARLYLKSSPEITSLVEYYLPRITIEHSDSSRAIGRAVMGVAFMLVEESHHDVYIQAAAEALTHISVEE